MDRMLATIIEKKYAQAVARVIYRLRRIKAEGWTGDDASERTLWDHWKRNIQDEHCVLHDLLESQVEAVVRGVADDLPWEDGALMTMATEWFDTNGEAGGEAANCPDEVAAELMKRVGNVASNQPHRPAVQQQQEAVARDRHTRDTEQ